MLPYVVLMIQPKRKVPSWVHYIMQISKHQQVNFPQNVFHKVWKNSFSVEGGPSNVCLSVYLFVCLSKSKICINAVLDPHSFFWKLFP